MPKSWTHGLILALGVTLAFAVGRLVQLGAHGSPTAVYPSPGYRVDSEVSERLSQLLQAGAPMDDLRYARVASAVRPSVVSIEVVEAREGTALGSGIVLDDDGHILTSLHVVDAAEEIRVVLSSGDFLGNVTLVGSDRATDLAVLRLPAEVAGLRPATFLLDEEPFVGQEVLAIGNAYGLDWTVSRGIVSSLHRTRRESFSAHRYTDFVQTDAAVNPGNSGGPLVDLKGRVIAINSVIVSESGDSAGVSLALPAVDAWFVAQSLVREGRVQRGYLGVTGVALARLSREQRLIMGVDTAVGVLVTSVATQAPAAVSFRKGDVILTMDGYAVASEETLRSRVARSVPGTVARFKVVREGERMDFDVTLGTLPVG